MRRLFWWHLCTGKRIRLVKADDCVVTNKQEIAPQKINIYPNPTNDVINIDYQNKDNSNLRITLTGLDGKEYDLILCKNQISLEKFKPGIYVLTIQNQSGKILREKINKL